MPTAGHHPLRLRLPTTGSGAKVLVFPTRDERAHRGHYWRKMAPLYT